VLPTWLSRFFLWSHLRSSAQVQILFQQAGLHVLHQQSAVSDHVLITVGWQPAVEE
jgi:hypothetical protein